MIGKRSGNDDKFLYGLIICIYIMVYQRYRSHCEYIYNSLSTKVLREL